MDVIAIKKRINNYVNSADERILNIINAIIEQEEKSIVAYTTDGKPLTLVDYNAELLASEKEIERGEIISQADLEKESEQW